MLNVEFYILLTVHLDVILVNDQLDALFLNVFISCLYMFRANCSSSGGPTRINTSIASIIIDFID
jgi:hypothetical protein